MCEVERIEYDKYIERFIAYFDNNPKYISNLEIEKYINENGLLSKWEELEAITKYYDECQIPRSIFKKYDYKKIKKKLEREKYAPYRLLDFENSLKLKRYSKRTILGYSSCLFLSNKWFMGNRGKSIDIIDEDDALQYFLYLTETQKYSYSTVRMYRFSLEYYYIYVIKRPLNLDFMNKVKKEKHLPEVLTNDEIILIIDNIENIKHNTIVSLLYSSGLRISEVVNLKVKDISLSDLTLKIRGGKGNKDRITIFSDKLLNRLTDIVNKKQTDDYLFTSNQKIGEKLSTRTVQKVFKTALARSGVKKSATCHDLRNTFATNLLESGVNLQYIQHLLGHKNISTTTIYTKVAKSKLINIKSPM